jgi:ubiquinone/menaquinone biosynthesis C-methylase UbiE
LDKNKYDEIFFSSKLNRGRHIEYLHTLSRLYGLSSTHPESSRVLDIGCGTGHALIPLAIEYPQSEFIGIDNSAKQIEYAKNVAKNLNLENIAFIHSDFVEYEFNKKFDFILCCGVFSWIPKDIQVRFLGKLSSLLNNQGVSLINFNLDAGFQIRNSIWASIKQLFAQSESSDFRKFLTSFKELIELDYQRPYQFLLYNEVSRLIDESDSYLLHEILAENVSSFSYSSFNKLLNRNSLSAVCDIRSHKNGFTRLTTAYVNDTAYESLTKLSSNRISSEDILDVCFGEPFREILVVASDRAESIASEPNFEIFRSLSFAIMGCQKIEDEEGEVLTLKTQSGRVEKINHKLLKELLEYLTLVYPNYLPYGALLNKFSSEDSDILCRALFESWSRGLISISTYPPAISDSVFAHPRTTSYIRHLTNNSSNKVLVNLAYESVEVDDLAFKLLPHLDGQTDKDDILRLIKVWLNAGEGSIKIDGKVIDDSNILNDNLPILLESTLNTLKRGGFLLP